MNLVHLASILFLWLPFAAAATYYPTIPVEVLVGIVPSASREELANISLRLYTGDTVDDYTSVMVGDAASLVREMDASKPTVFYIFGWTETPESTSVKTVVGAYLYRGDHNVMLINWQHIAAKYYPGAAVSVLSIGETVAAALDAMVAAGLDSSRIHIGGHSLGAQTAGAIGRKTNFDVPRITGLDPAGPGYYIVVEDLKPTDADFVDVIHTDAGALGSAKHDGIVNSWPNGGGGLQPGCRIEAGCSHARSWRYYAESVLDEGAFSGVKCGSNTIFAAGFCKSQPTVAVGYPTPTSARGNYYFQTNSESPFGRGEQGETNTFLV